MTEGMLYLLHFTVPLGRPEPRMSASHYLGWTDTLEGRLRTHRAGKGPAITVAALERGAELVLAWSKPGTRDQERRMKGNGHFDRRCAVCKGI